MSDEGSVSKRCQIIPVKIVNEMMRPNKFDGGCSANKLFFNFFQILVLVITSVQGHP